MAMITEREKNIERIMKTRIKRGKEKEFGIKR